MKLRKLPEPALSRVFTGEVFREKLLFCLCKRSGVSTVASHTSSHQRLLLLLGFGESSFPLCSHLAPSVWVGSLPCALRLFYLVVDGPTVLLAISPLNFQADFLPDQISVGPL